ncbi:YeeE/YedE family protein [Bradyrhizobium elkanii]|uniref:YeeE/YedE family protein n=1 Tax=Bradyrhizobium elkanii TaxID=29448 RepID=UPI002169D60D|nr:YeeE/YedE family protein [Bradyrhizobium elkanii]MCS3523814.1 putative membrane protein YedE/YeeE [Bradyrhizobium elkanii]MCS4071469.1 putative membrane protein YedE/YeeE [Bradyrhizobium elkanii]MCS4078101.1 putative membrane protein YedE/YeeE [Bradyrhizobium elkanii]MCW2123313.1 putative membrane protein YedE/YeeE [Bradyrhizobium elkanii]MCW2170060.1 putative membrane protein YedE/YeeE [Bradyrhizobium elkanii]
MNLESLVDLAGETAVLTAGGLLIGVIFGGFAQVSKFCLRSAVIEFSQGLLGSKIAIWLLTFSAAVVSTQAAIGFGLLDVTGARQLAARGSLSGSLVGGVMFGVGMILARGCASRLLVLSATGNLRALVSGLVLTIVAQASLRGALSPAREMLSELWTVQGGPSRNLLSLVDGAPQLWLGVLWLACALWLARRARIGYLVGASAVGVGLAVGAGWLFTYRVSQVSFSPVQVKSISFTGPSADTLMGLINSPSLTLGFDTGLVPGVFAGSLLAALITREWKVQGFHDGPSMWRYLIGAALMGFGGMLAGGCAVGAGVTGGAIFALTAWMALAAMWAGAIITHLVVDGEIADPVLAEPLSDRINGH